MACEHILIPSEYKASYPFTHDGKLPTGLDWSGDTVTMPDPLVWMAYVASATRRIHLTTGVVILPLRNPVVLAKQLATLDQLSKGRVSIGIGVGWLQEEFDAVGIPWEKRGLRANEYIEAMRALWRDDVASYQGEFVKFTDAIMMPKPMHQRRVPIIIGGHGEIAARRAGRLGDGFFPAIFPNSEVWNRLPGLVKVMRETALVHGRDPDSIEITSGGTRRADEVGRWQELGITRMVIRARSREPGELRDELMRFGDEVIAKTA